jgi:hypothetical protein
MAFKGNSDTDASVAQGSKRDLPAEDRLGGRSQAGRRASTLDELEGQFAAISARIQTLVASAGAEMCARPPAVGSWSAAECIEHLSLSADAYFPVWQQVIATAGPRKAEMNAPYAIDFWGRFLSWILEPPARIRSKTPVPFQPIDCGTIDEVLSRFLERQERIVGALRRCRGRAIDEVKMASPVDSRIKYSIWSSFVVNAAHQRRHLWQAEQAIVRVRAGS